MCVWQRNIQRMIDEIDACIRHEDSEEATLTRLAGKLGYSESYVSRKFRSISAAPKQSGNTHRQRNPTAETASEANRAAAGNRRKKARIPYPITSVGSNPV